MRVENVHTREIAAPVETVGALIDTLASRDDRLWPHDIWPRMRLDRPLGVGATGGHGPIRYTIVSYEPGRRIEFKFLAPAGFDGTHGLKVEATGPAHSRLTHTLSMRAKGLAAVTWTLLYRPLHDALVEDAMSRAEMETTGTTMPRSWSPVVRGLRSVLAMRRRRRLRTV